MGPLLLASSLNNVMVPPCPGTDYTEQNAVSQNLQFFARQSNLMAMFPVCIEDNLVLAVLDSLFLLHLE